MGPGDALPLELENDFQQALLNVTEAIFVDLGAHWLLFLHKQPLQNLMAHNRFSAIYSSKT
jgi:hypothetical protein